MASSKLLCDPCQVQDKYNEASHWCPDCEENLCTDCSSHHKSLKATKNHNLIKISAMCDLPTNVISEEVCPNHDQLFIEYFCTSHDELCCRACLADKHRTCDDVKTIDLVCKNAKSILLEDTKSETKHIIETLESVKTDIGNLCSDLIQTNQKTENQISEARREVSKLLENAEKGLVKNLHKKAEEFIKNAEDKSCKIKDLMFTLDEKMKQIEFVEKHGTEKQAFYLAHKSKSFFKEVETSMARVSSINSATMTFVKSPTHTRDALLGIVSISEQTLQLSNYTPVKQKQAQFTVERSKPLTTFNISSNFQTKCREITGMITTDDGKMLLCNYKHVRNGGGVYVYHQTGQYIKHTPLNYPFDISYMRSTDQYVVTLPDLRYIQFIDKESLTCQRTARLDHIVAFGIASTDTEIYIASYRKVLVLDKNGTRIESRSFETKYDIYYLQTTPTEVYISGDRSIFTIDNSKEFIITDGYAKKIAVDNQGYVYVAVESNPSYIQRLTPVLKPDRKIDIEGEKTCAFCFNKDCSELFYTIGDSKIGILSCS